MSVEEKKGAVQQDKIIEKSLSFYIFALKPQTGQVITLKNLASN
jgi:hypothetical protein